MRLADPRAMAAAVLNRDTGLIAAKIADGQNKATKLKTKVPVYVPTSPPGPTLPARCSTMRTCTAATKR